MGSNQTRCDQVLCRATRLRAGAVGGNFRLPLFYDGFRSEPDLLLSPAKGHLVLRVQLSIVVSGNHVLPTVASYLLNIEKLLPEESRDRWCVPNVILVPSPVIGETLDSSGKSENAF